MHALQPPLIHRDIKIENVLISANNEYKLCDFGSVCGIIRPPRNSQELSYVQQDILKNTTAHRIYGRWVFFYISFAITQHRLKKGGDLAILSGKFEFPLYPNYSEQLKGLIRDILVQDPRHRPNVYQLLKRISIMQNVPCPINDIQVVQAPSSHLNLTELHQLSATQNILSLNSPTTMENTMPNATFQISMADNTTTAQMHPNRKPSQIAYDASFKYVPRIDPPLVEPLASSVSNNDNELKANSATKLKQAIVSEAHTFRQNNSIDFPLQNIIPPSTFVNTIDNSKDDLNKPSYEDLDVSKQNLKNSIQQRMIDKLNSSEESFNARKMSKVKLHEKGEIDKPIMLKSSGPISKDKKTKPTPPPKPSHLKPKPPPKPLLLAGRKLSLDK
ncbi:AIF_HP2_G0044780.mRNA.1.CDS.1 [Saccharomyces cerevisiae]|nr:AIF_HP2_G0044780.mRNA.1.CDS.1 [Saccharomyces cerevisiae]CAI6728691.1 AIF_HP2_G0044780.mRNA.1.CDS.1 [Saccharomyces cerevisiae]